MPVPLSDRSIHVTSRFETTAILSASFFAVPVSAQICDEMDSGRDSGDSSGHFVRHLRNEKCKTPNHWFVAYDRGPELRISALERAYPPARRGPPSLRPNLPAQTRGRLHGAHLSARAHPSAAAGRNSQRPIAQHSETRRRLTNPQLKPADDSLCRGVGRKPTPIRPAVHHAYRHLHRRLRIVRAPHHAHRAERKPREHRRTASHPQHTARAPGEPTHGSANANAQRKPRIATPFA